jgi:hypothetical protein
LAVAAFYDRAAIRIDGYPNTIIAALTKRRQSIRNNVELIA